MDIGSEDRFDRRPVDTLYRAFAIDIDQLGTSCNNDLIKCTTTRESDHDGQASSLAWFRFS